VLTFPLTCVIQNINLDLDIHLFCRLEREKNCEYGTNFYNFLYNRVLRSCNFKGPLSITYVLEMYKGAVHIS